MSLYTFVNKRDWTKLNIILKVFIQATLITIRQHSITMITRYTTIAMLLMLTVNILTVSAQSNNEIFTPSKYDNELRTIKLPLIEIVTSNGQDPTGTNIPAPDGLWGIGLTENEYVVGHMRMTLCDSMLYDSGTDGMKIRLRGNSSSYYRLKKPYKIKLNKKQDLLFRNDSKYADKEWVLLRLHEGISIRFLTGYLTGTLLDLGWQPKWEFVNVVINGDYKGDYILIESIKKSEGRLNIENSGFIIEDDAYWWNEDVYFKGDMLVEQTGYTFKYPDSDDVNNYIINNIRNFILAFEDALTKGNDISPYIDYNTFAAWLLAQDILGQGDSAGSNRYLIKNNFYQDDPTSSQMYMGPLWDFDAIFRTPENWCALHDRSYSFYFPQLLDRQDFYFSYVSLWEEVRETLRNDITNELRRIYEEKGEALDASRLLDHKRWNTPYISLLTEIDETNEWLKAQVKFIDKELLTKYQLQFIIDDEVVLTDSLIYREEITYPTVPDKNGYIFSGWDIAPSTMPAKDLTIRGSYVTISGLFEITDKNGTRTNPIIVDMFGRHYNEFEKLNRGIYIVNGKKIFVK